MAKQKPHHFFGEVFCISLIFIQLQYAHKRFLRNLYVSDLAHSLLSFFLFFQQLFLTGNITAVALGKHVFSHCSDGLSCDDLASHCCLDRDAMENVTNLELEMLAEAAAKAAEEHR